MLADEEMAEARRHPSSSSSWSGRPQLSERQAAALLAEEIEQQEGDDDEPVIDAPPAPKMRRPVKRLRAKKIRRPEPELPVVPQPHMLDGLPSTSTTTTTTPASVTRVRRQQGADRGDGDPTDQAVDESRVKRHGHMGSTGPVHSFVKTDKHGHYKWGVRHHVGHHFA
ncbi:hypothetical protein ONE63_001853 [Megalurothrips usitatus]|uniref:Uncharacterized protein n=1 Tax=Megalurothrips usitatus TaxID=439358 RepID=A0AAV7X9S8_9NEOP|nr:hypothetical protein ONE63_001853 [Megalurothrips usitatus]